MFHKLQIVIQAIYSHTHAKIVCSPTDQKPDLSILTAYSTIFTELNNAGLMTMNNFRANI